MCITTEVVHRDIDGEAHIAGRECHLVIDLSMIRSGVTASTPRTRLYSRDSVASHVVLLGGTEADNYPRGEGSSSHKICRTQVVQHGQWGLL